MHTKNRRRPTWAWLQRILSIVLILGITGAGKAPAPLTAVLAEAARQEAPLLQYKSEGHLVGFTAGQVYLAAVDHLARLEFVGAQPAPPQPEGTAASQEASGSPSSLQPVVYRDLWPGVEARFEAASGSLLKATYTVAAGADPGRIRLRYNTAPRLQVDGSLRLEFERGVLQESAPLAWQEIGGNQVFVEAAFQLLGGNQVGFSLGRYNPRYPLVIDPAYRWHTFYGGKPDQQAYAIAVDSSGNVYFTGAANNNFYLSSNITPTTGYFHHGNYDIIVGSYNASGSPVWIRLFGSDKQDYGYGLAVDNSSGHLYVTGSSAGTWDGPSSTAPLNPHSGGRDIVIIRIDKSTGNYLSHGFFGSSYDDEGYGIALGSSGNVVVAGYSQDTWDGPGSTPPRRAFTAGYNEIVVLGLTASSVDDSLTYNWHTFYGSSGSDSARGVALDASNNIYVSGSSDQTWSSGIFPPKHSHSGGFDITLLKLSSSGGYTWHTFYGSASNDVGTGIALNSSLLFLSGYSAASWQGDGSTDPQNAHSGGSDLTALALTTTGVYQWHTFFGSSSGDEGRGIAADATYVYLTGHSNQSWNHGGTGPLHTHNGDLDLVVVKMDASTGAYQWHTFYGSAQKEAGWGAAVTGSRLLVAGYADDAWPGLDVYHRGGRNTVILELTTAGAYTQHDFAGHESDDEITGLALDSLGNIVVAGNSLHFWTGPSGEAAKNLHGGVTQNLFVLKLDPDGGYLWHTFYGGAVATECDDIAIGGSDQIYVVGASTENWLGPGNMPPIWLHKGDGALDLFAVSVNSDGTYSWHTFVGGAGNDWANSIAVRGTGVFIAGDSSNSWSGPGGQAPVNYYAGGSDMMVARFSTSGLYQWHTFYGSSSSDTAKGLTTDSSGYLYVVGGSQATWNGPAPSSASPKHAHSGAGYDWAALKLAADLGTYQWHTFYGGTGDDFAYDVALDSQNHPVVVGRSSSAWLGFGGALPKNTPSSPSISTFATILGLSNAGGYRWHTFYGGNGYNELYGVAIDSQNFIYAVGLSSYPWVGPSGQLPLHPHTSTNDLALIMLNGSGDYVEHDFYGGLGADYGRSIAITSQGGLVVGGNSRKTWQGDGDTNPLNSHKGANDVLVLRLTALTNRLFLPLMTK